MTRNEFTNAIDEVVNLDVNQEMKIELVRTVFNTHLAEIIDVIRYGEDEGYNESEWSEYF